MEKTTEVTESQLAEWKEKYGEIYAVEVSEEIISLDPHVMVADLEDQPKAVAYIKKPDNKVINFAMQKLPQMLEAGKVIIKSCWLGGDERLRKDDSFLNAAALQVIELLETRQGRLKKV